jgi:hypothetical protein
LFIADLTLSVERGFAADNDLPGVAAAAHAEYPPDSTATATPMAVLDRFPKFASAGAAPHA